MKRMILFFILFCINSINAQNSDVINSQEYQNFKANYIKFYSSEEFFKSEAMRQELKIKSNNKYSELSDKDFVNWLNDNLKSTEFKTKEEALTLLEEYNNLIENNNLKIKSLARERMTLEKMYSKDIIFDLHENDIYKELKPIQMKLIEKWDIK